MISQQQKAYLVLRQWFLIPFPNNRNTDFLEKWRIQNWGQKYTRRSERGHLIVPESKEALEREDERERGRNRKRDKSPVQNFK